MIREALAKIVCREDLTEEEAEQLLDYLVDGNPTPTQVGAILAGLRTKGESVSEIAGFARALLRRAVPVQPRRTSLLDTCGTGGDSSGTFNISTATAFVVAAAGIGVAKHGNRAVSGRCGSADVLEALGARIDLPPEHVAECIDKVGIGFLFAPNYHPAFKAVTVPRKELGIRTIFNLLGPLVNPARVTYQVMGVYDETLCPKVAEVLGMLGCERAMVVHGQDGLDEISTVGPTYISILQHGRVSTEVRIPAEFFLVPSRLEHLAGGATPEESAGILRSVLSGERGPRRDIVTVNAAAAMIVAGIADTWRDGIGLAQRMIDSKRALRVLEGFVEFTRDLATHECSVGDTGQQAS